jgi:small subunit ribosomal protein S17
VSRSDAETSLGSAVARGRRKVRVGTVVSEAMAKTVVVRIASQVRHPLYGKIVRRSTKLKAHDETGQAHVGDQVRIVETRPLSKTKRWRVLEVMERAK